jgi:hypothetical protein
MESGEVLCYIISDLHWTEGENHKYFVEMKYTDIPKLTKKWTFKHITIKMWYNYYHINKAASQYSIITNTKSETYY